ncbi:MAG: hypothetical protein UD961_01680 [Bacteroidales bacterium]|nr:hypothetical protein [Bacteroidales bacterium]
MGNITSVHIQACKTASSEIHNLREKDLSYVRDELSHLNESVIYERITPALSRIEDTYTKATGQKMQPSASPLKEAVLVIREDTTMEDVKHFGELCQKEFGITPIQYHIHKDEGHYDSITNEWKPNLHAHIVFDFTCYEHRMVEKTAKSNGKTIKNESGNPEKKMVDNYGKSIKLSKSDMSRMQDLAAIATGMERGVASNKIHLDAQRYKAQAIAEDIKELQLLHTEVKEENQRLSESNEALTASINMQSAIIEKQKSEITALQSQYDIIADLVTDTYIETKEKAIITINEYDKVVNYADEQLKTDATDLRNAICEDDSSILVERNVPIMYLLISKLEDAITKVIRGLYNLLDRVKEDVSLSKAELEKIELQKSIKTTAKAVFDRVTDSLGISPRVRSLSKAFDESQAQIKDMDAQMKEQEELHKSQLIHQQETFKCENEKQLETIASKDETIAILCRQNTRLDKEMGELVDKYNRIQAKAERLEKERDGFRTLVESKNHCIRETYFILFDNIEPRSLEKLGDLGLRQLIGKESWEKLKHLDDISMSQSIKKGPRL